MYYGTAADSVVGNGAGVRRRPSQAARAVAKVQPSNTTAAFAVCWPSYFPLGHGGAPRQKQGAHAVETILLAKNDAGQWGFTLEGGIDAGAATAGRTAVLVSRGFLIWWFGVASGRHASRGGLGGRSEATGVHASAARGMPFGLGPFWLVREGGIAVMCGLRWQGDKLVAVDGISVAGTTAGHVAALLEEAEGDVELTVVHHTPADLRSLFQPSASSVTEELLLVQEDVRADIYQTKVPFTTRCPREGEVDGVNYHFVSRETFLEMKEQGEPRRGLHDAAGRAR